MRERLFRHPHTGPSKLAQACRLRDPAETLIAVTGIGLSAKSPKYPKVFAELLASGIPAAQCQVFCWLAGDRAPRPTTGNSRALQKPRTSQPSGLPREGPGEPSWPAPPLRCFAASASPEPERGALGRQALSNVTVELVNVVKEVLSSKAGLLSSSRANGTTPVLVHLHSPALQGIPGASTLDSDRRSKLSAHSRS